jgi:hypothetical protein
MSRLRLQRQLITKHAGSLLFKHEVVDMKGGRRVHEQEKREYEGSLEIKMIDGRFYE